MNQHRPVGTSAGQVEKVAGQKALVVEPGVPQQMNRYRLPAQRPQSFLVVVRRVMAVAFQQGTERKATAVAHRRAKAEVVQQVVVVVHAVVPLLHQRQLAPR